MVALLAFSICYHRQIILLWRVFQTNVYETFIIWNVPDLTYSGRIRRSPNQSKLQHFRTVRTTVLLINSIRTATRIIWNKDKVGNDLKTIWLKTIRGLNCIRQQADRPDLFAGPCDACTIKITPYYLTNNVQTNATTIALYLDARDKG